MKSTASAAALLLLMAALAWGSFFYVKNTTRQFESQAYDIEILCYSEEYDQAYTQLQTFYAQWNETSKIFYTFLPHQGVLDVSFCAKRLEAYLRARDRAMILAEVSELRLRLASLISDETLDAANLL